MPGHAPGQTAVWTDRGEYRQAAGAITQVVKSASDDENLDFRDRYHRTKSSHYAEKSKAAGAWATTDGLAFVSHAGAVLSGRHPLGAGSRKSPHEKRHSQPDSESYLSNSAILLDATCAGAWHHGFWGKRASRSMSRSCRSYWERPETGTIRRFIRLI